MKRKLFTYGFLIALIGVTTWIIVSSRDIKNLPTLFKSTNKWYLLLSILCMGGYWFFDALIIRNISKALNIKNNMIQFLKITMIGQYYSLVTPFSTGGQPAQIYSMVSSKVPMGKATSILIEKFIIYQFVLTIYSIVMLMIRFPFIYTSIESMMFFIIIGMGINLFGVIIILLLFFSDGSISKAGLWLLKGLEKLRFLSRDQYEGKVQSYIRDYRESIKEIRKDRKVVLMISIMTVVQLTLYFSITYFIYRSLGLSEANYIDIISVQLLLYMAVSFFPTPGAVGASEGGFYAVFSIFFGKKLLVYAMVLWRLISYYLNLVISGIVTLIDYILQRKRAHGERGSKNRSFK